MNIYNATARRSGSHFNAGAFSFSSVRGRYTLKVDPRPGSLYTQMYPPLFPLNIPAGSRDKIGDADVALCNAKKTGRNRVVRFTKEMWKDEQY